MKHEAQRPRESRSRIPFTNRGKGKPRSERGLREAANDLKARPLGGKNKVVEADGPYIGSKPRDQAFGPPPKKMAVFTLVEREGKALSRHVADVTSKTLPEALVRQASRKSYL